MAHILIVDDEEGIRFSLRGIFEDEGYLVSDVASAEDALSFLKKEMPDLVFLDIWLESANNIDGMEVLQRAKELYPDLPIIMISGHANIENAVQALRYGADDFIEKPLGLEKVLLSARHALEMKNLRQENTLLRQAISTEQHLQIVANSPIMQRFMAELEKVAPTNAWVLITGENGTGKEVTAQTIHKLSKQNKAPFVAVNCAAIPEELIESELFGHEKGAFTGADSAKVGKFELAHNGTLFLDEIGDMSLKTQAKILRILQEQHFERVGGTKTIQVNVRVVAATNKDLEKSIALGEFRQDLYYRLRVFPLHLPPLRERKDDIPTLIDILLSQVERKYAMPRPRLSPLSIQVLLEWRWPGNVRELLHLLERLTILYSGSLVDFHLLPSEIIEYVSHILDLDKLSGEYQESLSSETQTRKNIEQSSLPTPSFHGSSYFDDLLQLDYKSAKNAFELFYLQRKLDESGGSVSKLSEVIGLERSHIHRKLRAGKAQSE